MNPPAEFNISSTHGNNNEKLAGDFVEINSLFRRNGEAEEAS